MPDTVRSYVVLSQQVGSKHIVYPMLTVAQVFTLDEAKAILARRLKSSGKHMLYRSGRAGKYILRDGTTYRLVIKRRRMINDMAGINATITKPTLLLMKGT